jgi:hypothetical protein
MTRTHIFLLVWCIAMLVCTSRVLSQTTFFKTYGDTILGHLDRGYAVVQTDDGGYIAVGEKGNFSIYGHPSLYYGDVYIVKTDENGDTLWTKTYGDLDIREVAYSIDKTNDGGFIICSCRNTSSYGLWILKIDSNGDSLWSKKYQLGSNGVGYNIKQTDDKGFVVTGTIYSENKTDIFLFKTDSSGDSLWLKTYDYHDNNDEQGNCVLQTFDGGYIIVGIGGFEDIRIIKTDSNGDTLWTKLYGGNYIDLGNSICATKDGGYLISGEYTIEGELGLELHIWLLKTDLKGDTTWTRRINNGSWGDYAYSCKRTSDGGFIIAGETTYDNFNSDTYLIKLDETGNITWESTINDTSSSNFRAYDVEETTDGGYIVTGYNYEDSFLAKVNEYGQFTEVKKIDTSIPVKLHLFQNYPNPFNLSTIIKYTIPESGLVTLKIYDVLGREIKILVNEYKKSGSYGFEFNAVGLSSGVYFYKIHSGMISISKKMVIVK